MQIVVVAAEAMQNEFLEKGTPENAAVHFFTNLDDLDCESDFIFYLLDETQLLHDVEKLKNFNSTIVVNAVTLLLNRLPEGFIRINAWPGFLKRPVIEVAANQNDLENVKSLFNYMGWCYHIVPDIAGLISARIIAMIINEAYFTLHDQVSTKPEIDLAMKLGTNYPYGPFEWSEIIGKIHVLNLLKAIAIDDKRYTPAPNFETV